MAVPKVSPRVAALMLVLLMLVATYLAWRNVFSWPRYAVLVAVASFGVAVAFGGRRSTSVASRIERVAGRVQARTSTWSVVKRIMLIVVVTVVLALLFALRNDR